jgi:hypothetical protein
MVPLPHRFSIIVGRKEASSIEWDAARKQEMESEDKLKRSYQELATKVSSAMIHYSLYVLSFSFHIWLTSCKPLTVVII